MHASPHEQPSTFGDLLRQHRLAAWLTQEALAERARLSTRAISDLERGVKHAPQRTTVEFLLQALALSPSDALAMRQAARRGTAASPVRPAVPPSTVGSRHNLPALMTSFVGRERPLAQVRELLASCRLLTLTGAGGCGKTRLALEAAREAMASSPDGVWFVDLAPLQDSSMAPQAVLAACGVRALQGSSPEATLREHLRSRRLVLVLDNCEHLVDACARLVDDVLRACPEVHILATSQEALGVDGEAIYRVPSMEMPDPNRPPSTGRLDCEAVRLFAERARMVRPDFAVTPANAPAVVEVCRRLDGIPLAIELAAARLRFLSPQQIASRLDDRFRLLASGSRVALARHQTLHSLIDWSHDLLTDAERRVLRRLAVFQGGWTLEAAEAVCADGEAERHGDGNIACSDVVYLLIHLVDKSLAVAEEHAEESRYRLLETIKQYAIERLAESGEMELVRSRHREWYVTLAERGWSALYGPDESAWHDRLAVEHDNLRVALERCGTDEHDVETALRLAGMLTFVWASRGYLAEGQAQLTRVLAMEGASSFPEAWGRALWGASLLACYGGQLDAARSLGERALGVRRSIGDRIGVIQSLKDLGMTAHEQSDEPAARAFLEEALACSREAGDEPNIATTLERLGAIAHVAGDLPAAHALHTESLAIRQRLGHDWGRAWSFFNLGCVAFDQGDYAAARRLLWESLALSKADANQDRLLNLLDLFAALDAIEGRSTRTAHLAGAASALRDSIGIHHVTIDRARLDRALPLARQAVSEEIFAAAWADGQSMTLDEAVDYALRGASEVAGAIPP